MSVDRYSLSIALANLASDYGATLDDDTLGNLTRHVQVLLEENLTKFYDVSLDISFEASSPEDAVRLFIDSLRESLDDWVYVVTDENDVKTMVDTYNWSKS